MLEIHPGPVQPGQFSYLDGFSLYIFIGSPHPGQSRGPRNRGTLLFPYGQILLAHIESGRVSAGGRDRRGAGMKFSQRFLI